MARKKQANTTRKSPRAPEERGDVLDLKSAADFLKVSKPTFYRWLAQGKIEAARDLLGGAYSKFTEGFTLPDLLQARDLLGELES